MFHLEENINISTTRVKYMSKRKYIFRFTFFLTILALAIMLSLPKKYNTSIDTKKIFAGLTEEIQNVSSMTFENSSAKYQLKKNYQNWTLKGYNNYPADIKKINAFLLNLIESSFIDIKDIDSENYKKIGVAYPFELNNESMKVKIYKEDKILYNFIIGKSLGTEKNFKVNYFRNFDEEKVYLLKNTLDIPIKEFQWINEDIIKIARWRIKSVEINDIVKKTRFKIYRDNYASRNYKFDNLPKNYSLINNFSLNSLASVFESLKILDVTPVPLDSDNVSAEIKKNVTVETFDGLMLKLELLNISKTQYIKIYAKSDVAIREELRESEEKIVGIPNMKSFKEVIDEEEKIRFTANWLYMIDEESLALLNKNKSDYIKKNIND